MYSNNHTQLFREIDPPQRLLSAILARIEREHRRVLHFRLATFGIITFVSVLILIPVIQYALSEFYTSGFYEYASLFFDSLSRGYWRELLYSLTDALPSLALLLLITVGTVFVWSLRHVTYGARMTFPRTSLSI